MAEFDQLITQAKQTAKNFGGLLALLLAVKGGKRVAFVNGNFRVDGKALPVLLIQKELARVELKVANLIISYNERLWSKQWTLEKWREEMDKLLGSNHLLFAALALGGFQALEDSKDIILRRVKRDADAIERFSNALRYGQIPSLPVMQRRGRAYLRSVYVTFQLLRHKAHILSGFNEAKRVLTPSEHCTTEKKAPYREGCLEVAAKGWLPILSMPPIGTLVCGQFCKCYIVYR